MWVISAELLLDNVEETRTVARVRFESPAQWSGMNARFNPNIHT